MHVDTDTILGRNDGKSKAIGDCINITRDKIRHGLIWNGKGRGSNGFSRGSVRCGKVSE